MHGRKKFGHGVRRLFAAIALTPGAALAAGPFDGLYKPAPTSDCSVTGAEGGAIEIAADTFTGLEAACRMTGPVNVRDMTAILYDMECTADDKQWSRRALLMNATDGGLILVWDGFAFKYDRCPEDPAAGTVTTSEDIGLSD